MTKALTLDNFIKVAFCLEGRDKITKLCQYGSRAIAWYLLSVDPKSDVGKRLSILYKTTQQSRKTFRLGKSITYCKKINKIIDDKSLNPWQKYLQLIQNIGMFGFFIYDNMVFVGKAQVIHFDTDEAAKRGGVLWFCANIAGFALALNNVNADIEKEKCIRDIMVTEEDESRIRDLQAQVEVIQSSRNTKMLALLKVTCDLIVSSNTSGIRLAERILGKKLHDGIIGCIGCVSALVVLHNTWPNTVLTEEMNPKEPTPHKL